jgi:hypothetical protein
MALGGGAAGRWVRASELLGFLRVRGGHGSAAAGSGNPHGGSIFGSDPPNIEPNKRFLRHPASSAPGRRPGCFAILRAHGWRPPGPIRVLHLEDSELDHELAMAHLRRGAWRDTCASRPGRSSRRARRALGRDRVGLQPAGLLGPAGAADAARSGPSAALHPGVGRDRRRHRRRADAQRRQRLPAEEPTWPGWRRRWSTPSSRAHAPRAKPADRDLQASRQRLSELAQHLQTSVEMPNAPRSRARSTTTSAAP